MATIPRAADNAEFESMPEKKMAIPKPFCEAGAP